jgi:hypothetical protein
MLPYERFDNEADFRRLFVKPLLNRLGYYGVSEQHGTQEFGKDFVFSELHRLGGMRHYAAQVKHEARIGQGASVDGLLSQVRQAFARPFKRPESPRPCYVSAVFVFNSGEITPNATEQMLSELERERYGDNVHFIDGERLEALNEWATLQHDADARARLLGLRSALRYNIGVLKEDYVEANDRHPEPLYIHGIELYLSAPVTSDNKLLSSLFTLWRGLSQVEEHRARLEPLESSAKSRREILWRPLVGFAQTALSLATQLHDQIDVEIQNMKPLEGS